MGEVRMKRKPRANHVILRGRWGNPWGFESPLRDHFEIKGDSGVGYRKGSIPYGGPRCPFRDRIARKPPMDGDFRMEYDWGD